MRVYRIAAEPPLNPLTLGGAPSRRWDTLSKIFVCVIKVLVGKQWQIQQSRQGIVCSHQGELDWAAQRAQVRPQA